MLKLLVLSACILSPNFAQALQTKIGQSFRVTDAKNFGGPFSDGTIVQLVNARLVDNENDRLREVELTFRQATFVMDEDFEPEPQKREIYSLIVTNLKTVHEIPGLLQIVHFRESSLKELPSWLRKLINN